MIGAESDAMTSATPSLDGLSLETLDVISPAQYETNGYPHAEWTYLRDTLRCTASTRAELRSVLGDHEARGHRRDRQEPDRLHHRAAHRGVHARRPLDEVPLRHLLTMDPPEHRDYRAVTAKQFTPRMVHVWEPKVAADHARDPRRGRAAGTRCDFVQDVSAPITIAVIAEMLGVPGEDWKLLFRWTNETIAPEDPEFQQGRTTEETLQSRARGAVRYFSELSRRAPQANPKDDIMSVVAAGKVDGKPLEPFELMSYYLLLVVAGNETTRNAITGGMLAFVREPGRVAAAGREPGAARARRSRRSCAGRRPVIQFARDGHARLSRCAARRSAKGEAVCLFYASGNRDEEIFDEPFRFRIDRAPNDHVGFGRGEHVCLGAHLARLELRTVFAQLRERLESIERTARSSACARRSSAASSARRSAGSCGAARG